jgi:hypothetical protein
MVMIKVKGEKKVIADIQKTFIQNSLHILTVNQNIKDKNLIGQQLMILILDS